MLFTSCLLLCITLVFVLTETTAVAATTNANWDPPTGALELPPLPYEYNALEPYISQRTLEIHHDKHHAKYVNTVNEMIQGSTSYLDSSLSLQDIVKMSYQEKNTVLFNNAAQSWNHAFYWNCMKAKNGGNANAPPKDSTLYKLIMSSFGSYEQFKTEFAMAGNTAFGSGWAWLVYCNSNNQHAQQQPKLQIMKTIGADNPMVTNDNLIPILAMDVWEHAYYLDYQNMRNTYVDTFLDKLIDWDFVAENLERAMKMEEKEEQQQGRGSGDGSTEL